MISHERPEFANWMLANERKILVELLDEAESRGEFVPPGDKEIVAEMIQSATMKFRYPQLWSKLTLPKLERELEGVSKLIIEGLCPAQGRNAKNAKKPRLRPALFFDAIPPKKRHAPHSSSGVVRCVRDPRFRGGPCAGPANSAIRQGRSRSRQRLSQFDPYDGRQFVQIDPNGKVEQGTF